MHQDRGRLPPGRPLSLRANQATSLPGGPMRHTAREEPHAPIRAAVLSIRVCGTAAEPHAPIRATVPPALVCGAAPACRSCADRATRGRHHRRAAKTPCTNSAARRRCADRASRGPASSRRAAKTPCTNSPSQPPPRSCDRQQPWRRRDRGSCTVRTGPLANQVTHSRVRTPCTCSLTARRDRAATPHVQRWHPDFQRRHLAAAAAAGQRRVGNQQQRPLAPIQAAVSATQGGRGRQDPMHLKQSPNRRCPPSHPACNETMARLAQQRAAR
jgi:hypothetical protein